MNSNLRKSGKILHELMDVLFLLIHKYSNILCLCVGVWINYSKNKTLGGDIFQRILVLDKCFNYHLKNIYDCLSLTIHDRLKLY